MRFVWVVTVLSLAACSDDSMTRNFGLARDAAPDTVAATQMPLSMPPTLALRPTRPGATVPRQTSQAEPAVGMLDRTPCCRQPARVPPPIFVSLSMKIPG